MRRVVGKRNQQRHKSGIKVSRTRVEPRSTGIERNGLAEIAPTPAEADQKAET